MDGVGNMNNAQKVNLDVCILFTYTNNIVPVDFLNIYFAFTPVYLCNKRRAEITTEEEVQWVSVRARFQCDVSAWGLAVVTATSVLSFVSCDSR